MKILNLHAGIGGNRRLWGEEHEVTAVEHNEKIARQYQKHYPNDKVVIGDAEKYLLEHYKEFDFIWASPPCPTHSKMRLLCAQQEGKPMKLPDMRLYGMVIFLKHFAKCKWVVENVIGYYEPLIKPYIAGNHYFWSNFYISNFKDDKRGIIRMTDDESIKHKEEKFGFELPKDNTKRFNVKVLNNCVDPKVGLHVFNEAFKIEQKKLTLC